ncbi:TetR/AcrR family transcriptional regulator [Pyxidicoccus xibeiensis]|uniref:TetR/AcrR family transcriptional regulator n=1 Tax=Pyxidicoccus xibeiensis TaxID=2906759 RepID=UPI0020A7D12D|nr:TetR family transcriptional regulator [Pyxidicoccus xibeiensis]MCP3140851.1 TetR/AcrR family transcriptional regulator [Pyxidicoccus xibeiensis]
MPRPKLHSDEAILDAAMEVLLRRGPGEFTLNDVAVELGMSRAALIQRFKNKDTLYRRAMERSGEQRRDYLASMPVEVGAPGLWRFLTDIVAGMGSGEGLEGHLLLGWQDLRDTTLRRMALERNLMVRDAIAARLPESAERDAVAAVLQDVIVGATMQWMVERQPPLTRYVLERLRRVLRLMFPKESFELPKS